MRKITEHADAQADATSYSETPGRKSASPAKAVKPTAESQSSSLFEQTSDEKMSGEQSPSELEPGNPDNQNPDNQAPSFEAALSELETIVSAMESDELALEQSLGAYKRGTELLQFCQQKLADVEQQILILNDANQLQTYNNTND